MTWHAWSNNAELALVDPLILSAGVALTHKLDDSLGVRRKTVLSQRDVPGMERSTIPVLKRMVTHQDLTRAAEAIATHGFLCRHDPLLLPSVPLYTGDRECARFQRG